MDLLFADKPAGVTTHTSHGATPRSSILIDVNDGFAEHLGARMAAPTVARSGAPAESRIAAAASSREKLLVAHRLDRDTTGAICFARTPEKAESLREIFESRRISKRYLFLTDRLGGPASFEVESFIERRGALAVSEKASAANPANAHTKLRKLDESDGLALWEAIPLTGRLHQIRLHAQDSGIPILGDSEHGGAFFHALCLHSEHLVFNLGGEDYMFATPPPRWFTKRTLAQDPLVAQWLISIDRRERLLRSWAAAGASNEAAAERTIRWIHSEGDPLRAEQLGSVISLQWFSERPPTSTEQGAVERLCSELGWDKWQLKLRRDRGASGGQASAEQPRTSAAGVPTEWTAKENGLSFEFRAEQGLSPGLFLDQRRNRAWVSDHAKDKRVLNLFCYTGGFSVAAARGGAKQVVSVDLSKQLLEWSKRNFALNGLATEGREFRAIDSRVYLAWAKKKGLLFDLVICDPPSFSRSESGIFKIEQHLGELVTSLLAVTAPGGRVLFATNFESWTEEQLEAKLRAGLPPGAQLEATPSPDWDFELPGEPRNMKSVFLVR